MVTTPFPIAAGYGNATTGYFSPDLFAPNLLDFSKEISIVDKITNNEYEGMLKGMGDTVWIRHQPQITVTDYTRGKKIEWQDIEEGRTLLTVDKAKTFAYKLDDVMLQQADVNYEASLADSAKYAIRDSYDQVILTAIAAAATDAVGSTVTIDQTVASGHMTPLDALGKLSKKLNDAKAPQGGRWAVMGTDFLEALQKEAGLLADASKSGDQSSVIADLGLLNRKLHNFTLFMTTNCPANTLLAGTDRAFATAQTLDKVEVKQLPDEFGYGVAGLHVYGYGVIRGSELVKMTTSVA